MSARRFVVGVTLLLSAAGVAQGAERPAAVSPGSTTEVARIHGRCPSFHWGRVEGAQHYELMVYAVGGERDASPEPVLDVTLPGSVTGWTPALDQCLAAGERYAWTVRALGEGGAPGRWSGAAMFEVAAGPSDEELETALEVVRRYQVGRKGVSRVRRDRATIPEESVGVAGKLEADDGGVSALAPAASATPSLTVDDQIHLGESSDLFKGGSLLLWDDAIGNFGLGRSALSSNTTGVANTASGNRALFSNETGFRNTASGFRALFSNTVGRGNTATGFQTLVSNTDGTQNTGTGLEALHKNTAGFDNTASGYKALWSNTTGKQNTAIGTYALFYNETGDLNVALGRGTGDQLTTGSNNIHIANHGVAGETATIKIGTQGTQTKAFVAGIYGSPLSGNHVVVTASGQLGTGTAGGGFDAITTGTNTSATMTVGSGASLSATGSGTIAATAATTAAVATALGADGGNCPAGQWAAGVDVSGNAQGCTADGGVDHGFATGNTRVGSQALASNTTGIGNTASGYEALFYNTIGKYNTAIGLQALSLNTGGVANTATGFQTLVNNTTGMSNTASGYKALFSNTTGHQSTASGYEALFFNTTGKHNTAIGTYALFYNNGDSNVALGRGAGDQLTSGSNNIHIANHGVAGEAATIKIGTQGTQTTAFVAGIYGSPLSGSPVVVTASGQLGTGPGTAGAGFDAITSGTNTSATMTVGSGASLSAGGTGTIAATTATALGADGGNCPAGQWAAGVDVSGNAQGCTADGGIDHGFAGGLTRVGTSALFSNTTGVRNTATGFQALAPNTIGSNNTASGFKALHLNTEGSWNTASGSHALASNSTGFRNTANGFETLVANTEGFENTASGYQALHSNTTGERNTAIGTYALFYNTGDLNVALGRGAGDQLTSGSNNIHIANHGLTSETATIKIGTQGTQTKAFVAGIRGITTGLADAMPVMVDSAGQLGTVSSSRRYKKEIHDMADSTARLLALRPVTFRYKKEFADGERPIQFGLVAEEVAEVFPELVVYDDEGRPETVKYHLLSTLLLNELQKQHGLIEEQTRVNQALAQKLAEVSELRTEVAELRALTDGLAVVEADGTRSHRIATTSTTAATANRALRVRGTGRQ